MKKEVIKALIFVILGIVIFTLITNKSSPDYIEKDTKVHFITDSTKIDSLEFRISYLENLPPDTVIKEIEIPVPVKEKDSSYTYTFPYRDSLLTSRWAVNTEEEVEFNKAEFSYILKRNRRVVEKTNTITLTKYRTKTVTTTLIENPKPYISVGGDLNPFNLTSFSPKASLTLKSKHQITYRYDPLLDAHFVGGLIPIKF